MLLATKKNGFPAPRKNKDRFYILVMFSYDLLIFELDANCGHQVRKKWQKFISLHAMNIYLTTSDDQILQ